MVAVNVTDGLFDLCKESAPSILATKQHNIFSLVLLDAVSVPGLYSFSSPQLVRTGFGPCVRSSNFGDQEIGTSPVLLPSGIRLDWTTYLFTTFVRHSRLSALSICGFIPPKHTRSIVPPPGFSGLIDSHKLSQFIWDVRVTIGNRRLLLFFTNC